MSPKVQTPPPPPTTNTAREDAMTADAFFRRKGQGANMVSTPASRSTGQSAAALLTGQG